MGVIDLLLISSLFIYLPIIGSSETQPLITFGVSVLLMVTQLSKVRVRRWDVLLFISVFIVASLNLSILPLKLLIGPLVLISIGVNKRFSISPHVFWVIISGHVFFELCGQTGFLSLLPSRYVARGLFETRGISWGHPEPSYFAISLLLLYYILKLGKTSKLRVFVLFAMALLTKSLYVYFVLLLLFYPKRINTIGYVSFIGSIFILFSFNNRIWNLLKVLYSLDLLNLVKRLPSETARLIANTGSYIAFGSNPFRVEVLDERIFWQPYIPDLILQNHEIFRVNNDFSAQTWLTISISYLGFFAIFAFFYIWRKLIFSNTKIVFILMLVLFQGQATNVSIWLALGLSLVLNNYYDRRIS